MLCRLSTVYKGKKNNNLEKRESLFRFIQYSSENIISIALTGHNQAIREINDLIYSYNNA